jgi:ATP-dependent RNA helicase DeaD
VALFKDTIRKTLKEEDLDLYLALVEELVAEGHDVAAIAAAATRLARGDKPLDVEVEPEPAMPAASPRSAAGAAGDGMVRLFVGAGRRSGIRPADIVGAIANEAGVPGKSIGAIDIHDTYTLVEVPREYAQPVLTAMAGAELRGKPVQVRLTDPTEKKKPRRPPLRKFKR